MKAKKVDLNRNKLIALGIPLIFFPGMVLASVLGWDWQKDLGKLVDSGGYRQSKVLFPTEAVVVNVSDGDTIEIGNGEVIRLVGINTPDRGQKGYEEAKEYLKDLIEGEKVRLEYDTYQEDKFGRVLAYVFEKCSHSLGCKDGERMINWVMVKKRFAEFVKYKDRRQLKYEEMLQSAQEQVN